MIVKEWECMSEKERGGEGGINGFRGPTLEENRAGFSIVGTHGGLNCNTV